MTWQSEVKPLKSVLLKSPKEAFVSANKVSDQWKELNYLAPPDFLRSVEEHQRLEELLKQYNVQVHKLPESDASLDAIYTRDASISTNAGMILCNMGKPQRNVEPADQNDYFLSIGVDIKGKIEPPGTLEGGDVAWIDENTLSVARGYRTNEEGIRQLKELVKDVCEEVIVFHAPHYKGPTDVFHLMSVYSPVDHDIAVVYSPLMSVSFRETLIDRGVNLIEVPEDEFDSLGCNVLAIAPSLVLITEGNQKTKKLMEGAGIEVLEYSGEEISLKGCGGPTCLTRPLERSNS